MIDNDDIYHRLVEVGLMKKELGAWRVSESEEARNIILYSRPNCPMNRPVLQVLHAAQAGLDYVDIAQDESARQLVQDINDGNETVPTLFSRMVARSLNRARTKCALNSRKWVMMCPRSPRGGRTS